MVVNFASVDLREPPVLILKNANGTPLGVLGNARNVSIDIKYNETSMLEFELPERVDGIKTPFYDLVNGMSLVELQGIGQFTVVDPSEVDDGLVRRKVCKAYSLEYELTYKTITIPEGTYNFWNPLGTGESVLGMILERLPSWSVGDIDQKLVGKYRTFEINNENIYNVIKSTLQESYQCIIDFDTYERKINVRAVLSDPATEPVFLSTQNLAKQIEVTEQSENIVTRLDVNGAEGVTIRDVNPTGTNKLIDLSHFMNTDNFPQTLIDKYNAWEAACDEYRETYYQDSIAYSLAVAREVAERAALVDLQGELTSIENIQAVAIEGIAQGIAAQDDLDEANAQLSGKRAEVSAKQADVNAAAQDAAELLEEMKAITQQCSFEAQFTADELKMLDKYLIDGDISDSSFVYSTTESFVGSDMSNNMASVQASITDATATRIAQGEGWLWDIRGGEITVGGIVEAELVSAAVEIDGEGKLTMSAYIANGTVQDAEIKKGCVSITSDTSTWTDDLSAPADMPTIFEGTELTVSATDAHFYFTYNVSELERRSVAWDLYEYGREALDRLSQPTYTFSVSSANFFSLDEFLQFRAHISLGERVYVEVDDGEVLKPICIGVRLTWEDPTSLELSFSDSYLSGDSAFRLADLLDKSASMSRKVDISKYTYASFADSGASSDIKNFMESALDIAKREILSTGEQAITIGDAGIRLRKWANDDKTAYDDKQIWMHNNSILMTKDNWDTASIAIGAFHDENAGDCWGIVAPMIAGTILAGSSLVIESEKKSGNGTSVFRVDENGCTLYDCDLNVLRGDTQIAINPHIGIAIGDDPVYSVEDGAYTIDEDNAKLWMDTEGNLHMKGVLDAASGNFKGNVTAESLKLVSPEGDVSLDVYISENSAVISASDAADEAKEAADAAQAAADAAADKAEAVDARVDLMDDQIALTATKAELESAIKNIEVGGTNLLRETRSFIDWEVSASTAGLTTVAKDENDFAVATISVNGATGNIWRSITSPPFASEPVKGKPFVVSVMCMVDDVGDLEENYPTIGVSGHIKGGDFSTRNVYTAGSTKSGLTNMPEVVSGKWFKFCLYGQFTPEFLSASDQEVSWEDIAEFRVTFYLPRNGRVHWKQAKIEIGEIATDWSPAPEDTEAYISGDPPNRAPAIGRLWIDESEEPSVIRKWLGADVTTEREYTETRVGCGKNLLNDASIVTSNAANTTVMIDGHAIRIRGAGATYRSGRTHIYLPAGTYTIKADIAVTSGVARITRRASTDGGRTYPSATTDSAPSGANGYTFTVERGGEWNRISFYATWETAEDGDVTYSNIRLYAGTDATEFVPYEDVPFLALNNDAGQLQSVAVEAGCEVAWKNLIDIKAMTLTSNTASAISGDQIRVYTTGDGGTWRGAKTPDFIVYAGVTYTLSASLATYVSGNARLGLRGADDNTFISEAMLVFGSTTGKLTATFTPETTRKVYFSALCTNSTLTAGDVTFRGIQLETGETATAYEAYKGLVGQESVKITACGKNLFDLSTLAASHTDVTLVAGENSVHVSTTGSGGVYRGGRSTPFWIRKGVPYALSATLAEYVSGNARVGLRNTYTNTFLTGAAVVFGSTAGRLTATFTPTFDELVYLSALCTDGTTLTGDCTFANIQLEIGNAATEYEPYRELSNSVIHIGGNALDPAEIEYGGLYGSSEENPGSEWATNTRLRTGYIPLPNALIEGVFKISAIPSSLVLNAVYMFNADKQILGSSTSDAVPGGYMRLTFRDAESGSAEISNDALEALREGLEVYVDALYGLPEAMDSVDVSVDGDVLVTRRTGVFIMDGDQYAPYTSTFATPEGVYAYTAPLTGSDAPQEEDFAGACSHFTVISRNAVQSERVAGTIMLGIPSSGDRPQAWFFTTHETAEAFNAWLQQQVDAGTPVTLVYERDEPATETMTAVAPIAPDPGQINILVDADALTATIYGSGWEVVNDTSGLRVDISEIDNTLATLEEEFGMLGDTVAQHSEFIVSPDKIFAQVAEASKYNEQINALRVEIEANADGITLRKEEIEAIGGRVSNIESGVHIDGSDIGLYSSDSPFTTHITHEGVIISENDMPTITVKENKMTSPRVHITDSLIFGEDASIAFRYSNGHFMMLKYGG